MNERQLPGLSLDFPRRSCQGSAERRARAMLRLQWRDHDSGAGWYEHTDVCRAWYSHATGGDSIYPGRTAIYACASPALHASTSAIADANSSSRNADATAPERGIWACDRHGNSAIANRWNAGVWIARIACFRAATSSGRRRTIGATVCARLVRQARHATGDTAGVARSNRQRANAAVCTAAHRSATDDTTGCAGDANSCQLTGAGCTIVPRANDSARRLASNRRRRCAAASESISFQGSESTREATRSCASVGHHHLPSGQTRGRSA